MYRINLFFSLAYFCKVLLNFYFPMSLTNDFTPKETSPYMSIYEMAGVVGARAAFLANNPDTKPYIQVPIDMTDERRIAEREVMAGVPFLLKRNHPNGTFEIIRTDKLIKNESLLNNVYIHPFTEEEKKNLKQKRILSSRWYKPDQE